MALLIEMTMYEGTEWKEVPYDDSGTPSSVSFEDTEDNEWTDTTVYINIANESFAGDKYWENYILSISPPQYRTDHDEGGYCKLSFGDMTVSPETFIETNYWPPPKAFKIHAYDSATMNELFNGTAHCSDFDRSGIRLQFYENTLDQELLEETTDFYTEDEEDTEPRVIPRAVGTVYYEEPLRLTDIEESGTTYQRYHNGYLDGNLGSDWFVYDDGLDVCDQVYLVNRHIFYYTVNPEGTITVSGTGVIANLDDLFDWACESSRFNLIYNNTLATEFTLSHWVDSQEILVSYLDKIAAYATHLFYIKNSTLYLMDMASDNGTDLNLTEYDFFPASISYANPISIMKAEWITKKAVEESIGLYVKEKTEKIAFSGEHPYGNEEIIDVYQINRTSIAAQLRKIYEYKSAPKWNVSIPWNSSILPGNRITATDESIKKQISIDIHVRDITYDFVGYKIHIIGEGSIT